MLSFMSVCHSIHRGKWVSLQGPAPVPPPYWAQVTAHSPNMYRAYRALTLIPPLLYRVQAPPAKRSKCKLLGKLTKNHVIKDSYTYYKYEKNDHLRKKTLINAMLFIDLPIVECYYIPFLLGHTHVFRAPHIKYTCHCQ